VGVTGRERVVLHLVTKQNRALYRAELENLHRVRKSVFVDELETLADSLGGGIGLENRHTFAMTRDLIDDVVLLDEVSIARGIVHAYREERLVVEGAAAVGIAALLDGAIAVQDGPIAIVVSGSNIDIETHRRLIGAA